jgi:hypothetical protein
MSGGNMAIEFTATQLDLMSETDKADIARAKEEGFKMPRYTRMYQGIAGEIKAICSPLRRCASLAAGDDTRIMPRRRTAKSLSRHGTRIP